MIDKKIAFSRFLSVICLTRIYLHFLKFSFAYNKKLLVLLCVCVCLSARVHCLTFALESWQ